MAATVADLERQNALLREELARLEVLEKLTADEEGSDSKQRKMVEKVKEAFDSFDKDKSGFIDSAELALLASQLGETLDEKELKEAMAAIDASGDHKISFGEFIRWWTSEAHKSSSKGPLKLAGLKAKLHAIYAVEAARKLLRQLSSHKVTEQEAKQFIQHRIAASLGDVTGAKATLDLKLSFEEPDLAKFGEAEVWVEATAPTLPSATPENLAKLVELLSGFVGLVGLPAGAVKADAKSNTLRVEGTPAFGPLKKDFIGSFGVDLKEYVQDLSFSIKLANGLDAFLLPASDEKTLAELLAFSMEFKVRARKTLFQQLAMVTGKRDALFATLLENSNLSLELGDFAEFLTASAPTPEQEEEDMRNLENARRAQPGNPAWKVLKQFLKVRTAIRDPTMRTTLVGLFGSLVRVPSAELAEQVNWVRESVRELQSVVYHTRSGIKVALTLNNFLPLYAVPEPIVMSDAVARR